MKYKTYRCPTCQKTVEIANDDGVSIYCTKCAGPMFFDPLLSGVTKKLKFIKSSSKTNSRRKKI